MRRVALTGAGVISPVGTGKNNFFQQISAGISGIRRLQHPDALRLGLQLAGQIQDFDPSQHFSKERLSTLDRFSQFALVAAREAWQQAAYPSRFDHSRGGVFVGTGMGGASTLEAGYDALFRQQQNRVRPMSVIATMPNAAAANIGIEFSLRGPCYTYAVACASSSVAIGEAARAIAYGDLDVALAGGAEAMLCLGVLKGWEALMTLAIEDKQAPEQSCKPFAANRCGFVLGEGAGMLVLEDLELAQARGATILAELVGYGVSNDAVHLSRPEPAGQAAAMRAALKQSQQRGIHLEDIGYINAHGTATKAGDASEVAAICDVFGAHRTALAISSTKAVHGHLMGAAGAIEFIATVLALQAQTLPPTAHLTERDPAFDLDFVPLHARPAPQLRAVMSNSFAFGGANAVLVAAHPDA